MSKKLQMRSVFSILLVAVMTTACLFGCSQAPSSGAGDPSSVSSSAVAANEMAITVEIDPSVAEGKVDLPTTEFATTSRSVELSEGATAYDALVATGATLEGSSSYVTSINGLAEKAAGPTHGWMYEVNGEEPTVAASDYVLQPGDTVRWFYTSWDES